MTSNFFLDQYPELPESFIQEYGEPVITPIDDEMNRIDVLFAGVLDRSSYVYAHPEYEDQSVLVVMINYSGINYRYVFTPKNVQREVIP
jgi:hypothetical protein